MAATATKTVTVREIINTGNIGQVGAALTAIKGGDMLSKVKVTFTGLTSAAAQDITTAAAKAAGTITGASFGTDERLPPIGKVVTLRVTAGTAAAGARNVTDAGGAASTTFALLSDDGKTLTFEAAVTGFVLVYFPAPSGGADQTFAQTGG